MRKKGFTLIELLVVIAIIGILATFSIISLQQSRARARDSRRLSDVKQMTTALAMYQHDASVFPATLTPGTAIAYNGTTYMESIPTPPIPDDGCVGSTEYTYSPQGTAGAYSSYTIKYCLGAANNEIPAGLNTATPAGIKIH